MSLQRKKIYIAVTGWTASGKSTVAEVFKFILDEFGIKSVILSTDNFYLPASIRKTAPALTNYDVPDAFDWVALRCVLNQIDDGQNPDIPSYDFAKHDRAETTTKLWKYREDPDIIIIEGIVSYCQVAQQILWSDRKVYPIFVKAEKDICLGRRMLRDVKTRGRTPENVYSQWMTSVRDAGIKYIDSIEADCKTVIHNEHGSIDQLMGVDDNIEKEAQLSFAAKKICQLVGMYWDQDKFALGIRNFMLTIQ